MIKSFSKYSNNDEEESQSKSQDEIVLSSKNDGEKLIINAFIEVVNEGDGKGENTAIDEVS